MNNGDKWIPRFRGTEPTRNMTAKDREFLARHRKLKADDGGAAYEPSKETIEISGEARRETQAAILWFDGTREAWVPKSIGKVNGDGQMISMPMWAAKDKGFI